MSIAADDWRLMNAEHLRSLSFELKPYQRWSENWDHDHCAACFAKFAQTDVSEDALHVGWAAGEDHPHGAADDWICEDCFSELSVVPGWRIVS